MSRLIAIVVACLALGGCATSFKKPAPGSSFGAYPHDYEDLTAKAFESILKDPESARYKFEPPRRAYLNEGLLFGGDVRWQGYLVKVEVNAKNSYGGYTGYKPYLVTIRDGRADQISRMGELPLSLVRVLDEPRRAPAAVGSSK